MDKYSVKLNIEREFEAKNKDDALNKLIEEIDCEETNFPLAWNLARYIKVKKIKK